MSEGSIYELLSVPTAINAAGSKTRIDGTPGRREARGAMMQAADSFVRLSDLQAGERIAEITGAEAGYITNGPAGGLVLAAAACLTGTDPAVMHHLPDTDEGRFVVNPMCLSDAETDHVLERIAANPGREAGV